MAQVNNIDAQELTAAMEGVSLNDLETTKVTPRLEHLGIAVNDKTLKLFVALMAYRQRTNKGDMEQDLEKIKVQTYDDAYQIKKVFMVIGGHGENLQGVDCPKMIYLEAICEEQCSLVF